MSKNLNKLLEHAQSASVKATEEFKANKITEKEFLCILKTKEDLLVQRAEARTAALQALRRLCFR